MKFLRELETSNSTAATKIRNDVQNLMQRGVICQLDDSHQPEVTDSLAMGELVKHFMCDFPNAVADTFRDAISNIVEPSTDQHPPGSDKDSRSIGANLTVVRATAFKIKEALTNPVAAPEKITPAALPPSPESRRQKSYMKRLRETLKRRWVPEEHKRQGHETGNEDDGSSGSKVIKIIESILDKKLRE